MGERTDQTWEASFAAVVMALRVNVVDEGERRALLDALDAVPREAERNALARAERAESQRDAAFAREERDAPRIRHAAEERRQAWARAERAERERDEARRMGEVLMRQRDREKQRAKQAEAERGRCKCGHSWSIHGRDGCGLIECRCVALSADADADAEPGQVTGMCGCGHYASQHGCGWKACAFCDCAQYAEPSRAEGGCWACYYGEEDPERWQDRHTCGGQVSVDRTGLSRAFQPSRAEGDEPDPIDSDDPDGDGGRARAEAAVYSALARSNCGEWHSYHTPECGRCSLKAAAHLAVDAVYAELWGSNA